MHFSQRLYGNGRRAVCQHFGPIENHIVQNPSQAGRVQSADEYAWSNASKQRAEARCLDFLHFQAEIRSGWGRRFRLPASAGPRPKGGGSDKAGSDRDSFFDSVGDPLQLSSLAYLVIHGFMAQSVCPRSRFAFRAVHKSASRVLQSEWFPR